MQNSILPSASLRRQQQLVRSLSSRNSHSSSSKSAACSSKLANGVTGMASRNPPHLCATGKQAVASISSAGDILCCSSINSSDIRNCNKVFLKNYEKEVASKVWRGALELGVEMTSEMGKDSLEGTVRGGTE
ncbi:hypothetical protein L195_g030515, partial [Trifolium pratense]